MKSMGERSAGVGVGRNILEVFLFDISLIFYCKVIKSVHCMNLSSGVILRLNDVQIIPPLCYTPA